MRQTTIITKCDHCQRTLKLDTFGKNEQLTVVNLQIQNRADPRANLHVFAQTESELLDFCNLYCLKEYIDDHFRACHDALTKADLEERPTQEDLTDDLADKEPGGLL